DTIEDTDTSYEEVEESFGSDVAQAVSALSKDKQLPTKSEQMEDSLDRILRLSKEVAIVKLADRISNLQGPPYHWSKEKAAAYREEAILIHEKLGQSNFYLAQRLKEKIKAYQNFL
ncbi:MAG: HD domain-containing protein, partial [Bacteroidota bacterium]